MKIQVEGMSVILHFEAEEVADLRGLLSLTETPRPVNPSTPHVILTDLRLAKVEQNRQQEKYLAQNQKAAESKLRDGLLPFRVQDNPPGIKVKESPRTLAAKSGQFAGEPPTSEAG